MRTKKTDEKISNKSNQKETLVCPICGIEFEVNDDTKYITAGGYTCSWKCFLNEVKRREVQKIEEETSKEKYNKNKNRKKS